LFNPEILFTLLIASPAQNETYKIPCIHIVYCTVLISTIDCLQVDGIV